MGETHVCANLHPILQAIVSLDASRIAVVVAVVNNTFVVEISERTIELQTVVAAGDVEVILLADAVAECQLLPVVGHYGVDVSVVVDAAAESGIRVHAAVLADEVFAVGHCVADVTQTTHTGSASHLRICQRCGFLRAHAKRIGLIVIQCFIICLVVVSRILDGFIVTRDAYVRTHTSVERNHCLTLSGALGGDHNHTVCATGTIEGCRRCILEHCH